MVYVCLQLTVETGIGVDDLFKHFMTLVPLLDASFYGIFGDVTVLQVTDYLNIWRSEFFLFIYSNQHASDIQVTSMH